jgi:hypothetical protein
VDKIMEFILILKLRELKELKRLRMFQLEL